MLTRHLKLPDVFQIFNADTGEPGRDSDGEPVTITRASVCRMLVIQLRSEGKLDVLDAVMLQQKLCGSGGTARLTEEEWRLLCEAARNPRPTQGHATLSIHAQLSPDVAAFFRSILDATTTEPKP